MIPASRDNRVPVSKISPGGGYEDFQSSLLQVRAFDVPGNT